MAKDHADVVDVTNLHKLARSICETSGWTGRLAGDRDMSAVWGKVWKDPDLGEPPMSQEELRKELDLVIEANGIDDLDGYLTTVRSGRPRISRRQRRDAWPFFRAFQRELKRRNLLSFEGAIHQARLAAEQGRFDRYVHVLVDEVQDFSLEAMRLVAALAPLTEEDATDPLCVAGDGHQRIYRTKVPLSRAGIHIRRIFVPDGNPDGLRIVEKSNWTGVGVVCPRSLYPEAKRRDEFDRTGVYVLVGDDEATGELILYIGEGDPVKPRLDDHLKKKDFWGWTIFFRAKDGNLNKAHVKHLESRLVGLVHQTKQARLDNTQMPQPPTLSESEAADAESFLLDILSIFPLMGLTAFEESQRPTGQKHHLYIKSKGIVAKGYESTRGFVVLKNSQAVLQEVDSIHRYLSTKRSSLEEQGVLEKVGGIFVFQQDYEFNSPSQAAGVVQGRAANGRLDWRDAQGRTLKDLQKEVEE